jgi:hypothetical protein
MMRYLFSGAAVAAPLLVCMAVVIYIFSPSSDVPGTQPGEMPASMTPRLDGGAFSRPDEPGGGRDASPANVPAIAKISTSAISPEDAAVTSPAEQADQWEELAFAETSDLQTRAESLVHLTRMDPARGEYALGSMIASDRMDDRHMAIALLRDWRDRTGDPDGRIAALLMQAASDPDAGVAYQAKAALDQVENYKQMENSDRSGSIEGAHQEAGIY